MTDVTKLIPGILFFCAAVFFGIAAAYQTESQPMTMFFLACILTLISSGGFVISFLKRH
ncbi:hypothetical protein J6B78_02705 [Methanocorpusculum sp.]|nr:hypothetical protein [Methanocorpusculum sp.]MBO5432417.1 hypothetical protein [Methanocorpusculum sp.]MBP3443583.1 hypothetical protein [Methanocorpusculaceae archaeon]